MAEAKVFNDGREQDALALATFVMFCPLDGREQDSLSASVTCRLQGRSLFAYMRQLLTAHARGDPLPTLTRTGD